MPTPLNLKIQALYGEKVKSLYDKWWEMIKTSKDITKNKKALEAYRKSLKPGGGIALLGCLTDGGVGLQTGNNGIEATKKYYVSYDKGDKDGNK